MIAGRRRMARASARALGRKMIEGAPSNRTGAQPAIRSKGGFDMLFGKRTIGSALDDHNGIGPGFDSMRIILAIVILGLHSIAISYGRDAEIAIWGSPYGTFISGLLPMFFTLSGFLVMGSASRSQSLRKFMILRGLRLFPALSTEITLSALIIGATLTTLPLSEYFTSHRFFAYFGSVIGRIRVELPGVFEHNPLPNLVNVTLWTIGPELLCYVMMALLIISGIVRHRRAMTVAGCCFVLASFLRNLLGSEHHQIGQPLFPQALLVSFVLGLMAYLWRYKIPYSWPLFFASLALALGAIHVVRLEDIGLVGFTYCAVFLGMTAIPKVPILSRGDYSYGIYLYGYGIQQAVAYLFPSTREWYWNILIALPVTIAVAMLSWRFVEAPTLALRKRLTSRPARVRTQLSWRDLATTFGCTTLMLAYAAYLAATNKIIPPVESLTRESAPLAVLAIIGGAALLTLTRSVLSKSEPPVVRSPPAMNLAFNQSGASQ